METPCLYSAIRDAIGDHYAAIGHLHGQTVVIDLDDTLDALEKIAGELLAGVPDPEKRTWFFAAFVKGVIGAVNDAIDHDLSPAVLRPH